MIREYAEQFMVRTVLAGRGQAVCCVYTTRLAGEASASPCTPPEAVRRLRLATAHRDRATRSPRRLCGRPGNEMRDRDLGRGIGMERVLSFPTLAPGFDDPGPPF
jgi:hypothetical protein